MTEAQSIRVISKTPHIQPEAKKNRAETADGDLTQLAARGKEVPASRPQVVRPTVQTITARNSPLICLSEQHPQDRKDSGEQRNAQQRYTQEQITKRMKGNPEATEIARPKTDQTHDQHSQHGGKDRLVDQKNNSSLGRMNPKRQRSARSGTGSVEPHSQRQMKILAQISTMHGEHGQSKVQNMQKSFNEDIPNDTMPSDVGENQRAVMSV